MVVFDVVNVNYNTEHKCDATTTLRATCITHKEPLNTIKLWAGTGTAKGSLIGTFGIAEVNLNFFLTI